MLTMRAMKVFSLLWLFPLAGFGTLSSGNAEFACVKAENMARAIEYFQRDFPHIGLTEEGFARDGDCLWCVGENFNPFL